MHFGKNIFAKKLLSLLVLITIIYPIFQPPIARGFSFFGFGVSDEKEDISTEYLENTNEVVQDKLIAILVEEQLIKDTIFASAVDRYAVDASTAIGGRAIVIPIPENSSVKEIYEGLAHLYFMGDENNAKSKLVGTVLIGNIPIPVVEKSGNLWPTIFPYTDFEKRVYLWDKEKNRFVFDNETYMEPEIWHGIIRSQKDNIKTQSDEILKFLDENHKVHIGETTFSDNLFYVNTSDQKLFPDFLESQYNRWLEFAEDFLYKRFNKTLLSDLESSEEENNSDFFHKLQYEDKLDGIAELMDNAGVSKETAEGLISGKIKTMPDIHTEMIIRKLANDYLSLNKAKQDILKDMINKVGAWSDSFDTTIKLVAKKDLESLEQLKDVNDLMETIILKQVQDNNLAGDIAVPHTVEFENPITKDLLKKPLYWNGIDRKNLTAKDCTLYRGSTTTGNYPYAQKVEANRTLDIKTVGSCASENAIDSVKYADKYEGCCAENIKDDGISTTYNYCDTGSQWYYGRIADDEYDHQGAELPVFDLGGTKLGEGPDGAFGCDKLLTKYNEDPDKVKRFDSLVLHTEPTQETIDKQKETLAQFLPVDDPRGFSFYDYQNKFYRFNFLNIFDLRGKISSEEQLKEEIKKQLENEFNNLNSIIETASKKSEMLYNQYKEVKYPAAMFQIPVGYEGKCNYSILPRQIDKFTKKITWNESCKYHEIQEEDLTIIPPEIIKENKIVKFYEYGTLISVDSVVENILNEIDFDKLYSSFNWLEKGLNEKNQITLQRALGKVSDFSSFLSDDFNGYELAHISTLISNGETLPIGFSVSDKDFDKDFFTQKAQNILSDINYDEYKKPYSSNMLISKYKVDLSDKHIESSTPRIFISKDNLKPIPVTFSIKDKYGKIDKKNYKTEIALKFSSSEINQFFDIFPSEKLRVTAGKVSFFLTPKKQNFGGKLTLQAYIPKTELLSTEIPIMVTRYDTAVQVSERDIIVNNSKGTLLTVYVNDSVGKITKRFDGKSLKFVSNDGVFQGGINTAQINNGKAEIRFFPGSKAKIANITIFDEELKLPDTTVKINILPDKPRYLDFKKGSKFLLASSNYQDISVQLFDRYNNEISNIKHELSWRVENGEILNEKEKDINPRAKGLQEWISSGSSLQEIRPKNKEQNKVRVSVSSSLLQKDSAISREFTVIKNPILKAMAMAESISVGDEKPIKIKLKAQTQTGELIDHNFKVEVSIVPVDFPHHKEEIMMKSGFGEFEFYPGTKKGKYTIIFSADGFENQTVDIDVVSGEPKKLQITTIKKIWDRNEKNIPIDILMLDSFGNRVNENEKISLSISDETKGVVSVPSSELFLQNGKVTVNLKSLGEIGKVHLMVEGNGIIGGSLELSIEDLLSVEEVYNNFNPKVKFMILSGPVGGNLFLKENVGNALLFSGKTQAVLTMGTEHEDSNLNYGFISQDGRVSDLLDISFIFEQKFPEILLRTKDKVVAKIRMIYKTEPNIYLGQSSDRNGIYITAEQGNLKLINHDLFLEEERLISFSEEGGINLISGGIELKPINNFLTEWNIKKDNKILGKIYYKLPHEIFAKEEYFKDDFEGFWLKSINNDTEFVSIFTGNSTSGEIGFSIKDKKEESRMSEKLGSSKLSIENSQNNSDIAWGVGDWKPATLFAGGNSIGISSQRGSSDIALLLGDPTLSRSGFTSITDNKTMGISIWKSPYGNIDDISYSDINEDGKLDLVLQVENQIIGLYQSADEDGGFVEETIISEANDGIKSMGSLTSSTGNITSKNGITGFIQINKDGDFILNENKDGSIVKKKLPFGQKFIEIKTANLNGDLYTDIVGIDKNQKLWRIYGEIDGFGKPKFIEDLSPKFDEVDEKNTDLDMKYLSEIEINYVTEKKSILTKNLSDSIFSSNLKINSDGNKLRIGDSLFGKLTMESSVNLNNFSLVIPSYKNIEFQVSSLECETCNTNFVVKQDQQTDGIIIDNLNLDNKSKLILTWQFKVKSLPDTKFFIGDFENGKDNLDDISVPWNFGERDGVLKFLSSKQQTNKSDRLFVNSGNFNYFASNTDITKSIFNGRLLAQVDIDKSDINTESTDVKTFSDNIKEELNEYFGDNEEIRNALDEILPSLQKGKNPSISMGAPGLGFDNLLGTLDGTMSSGDPIIDKEYYRFYLVPTTTGKIAMSYCTGLKSMFMTPALWNGNCYVKVLDSFNSDDFGTTSDTQLTSLVSGDENTVATVTSDIQNTSGSFSLETTASPNKNLPAVDIVTQWLKDQWRELTNSIAKAIPSVSFKPSDLSKSTSTNNNSTGNKYDKLVSEVSKYKFVNIQKIPLIISIPNFDKLSKEDLKEVVSVDIDVNIDLSGIEESIKNLKNYSKIKSDIDAQVSVWKVEQKKLLEEQLVAKVNKFVDSYDELKDLLLSLRERNIKLLEEALSLTEDLTQYFDSWLSDMDKKIQEWKDFAKSWSDLNLSLKEITIDFFKFFEEKFKTKAVDRGMSISWLFNMLAGSIDLPIISIPTFPDILVDVSEFTIGVDLKLADVELKKTDIDLHEFVDLSTKVSIDASAITLFGDSVNINFPTVTLPDVNFPELPNIIIPEINLSLDLPDLPIIPSPPKIPTEIVQLISDIMNIPTSFSTLFGMLRLSVIPVPEWYLKPYIENLTNEIALDAFFDLSLDPPEIQTPIPDINISAGTGGRIEVDFFEFLKEFFESDIDRISFHNNLKNKKLEIENLYVELVNENKILQKFANKPAKEFFVHKDIQNILMKNDKYFTANTSPILAPPQKITTKTLTQEEEKDAFQNAEMRESSIRNGMYLVNENTGELSKLINHDLKGETHILIKDIDDDESEEIYYTNGRELFVKYNLARELGSINQNGVKKWDYDLFKSKKEVALSIKTNNDGVNFVPFDEDISYYELFFSNRPDALFEIASFPTDRKSKIWKRYALAKQNLFKNYKISKIPARVIKIKGYPQIKMIKPIELMTYSEEKCQNPDVKKSFFSSRTILTATQDDTRLSIRVPAKQFKPAEYQIIKLHKGESTSIDYGKVCVFSGKLESVDFSNEPEVFDLKVGQMITSDMNLFMDNGDFVQFQTSGNSLVSVYDNDEYSLEFFDPNEKEINFSMPEESLAQNLYGFLIGFIDEQKTLVRRKIFFNASD